MNPELKKKLKTIVLPLALLIAGLYFVPVKIFQSDFSKIPGDYGDARFNNYILEHDYLFVTGKVHNYWDAPFMYPIHNVIGFSDNLLGTVPVYAAFRIVGISRESSFQCWFLVLFILNFCCCWWVLKKWSSNPVLAATGAYIFAFSIFILGNINHVQNFPRFIIPLVFYWTWMYLRDKKLKHLILLFFGIVFQFYCGIYLGFFLLYCLLFFFIAYLIIYRDKEFFRQFRSIKTIGFHLVVIVSAILLLAPLMIPYMKISSVFGMRKFDEVVATIPTFRSYFFTSKAPVMWESLSEHGVRAFPNFWDHFLFMGILPWIGIFYVPVLLFFRKIDPDKRKLIAFLSLGLLFSFIFCLNINGFTLYRYIFNLPGFSSMRSINRIINVEIMFFVLVFVFVFNELGKISALAKKIILAFPLLIIIDNLIDPNEVLRFDKAESQKQIAEVKKNIESQYDKKYPAIAYMSSEIFPKEAIELNVARVQLNVMFAAQELRIPCVNAYTGSYPDDYLDFLARSNDWSLSKWLDYNNHFDKNKIQNIYDFGIRSNHLETVQLKASNGKFVSSDQTISTELIANRNVAASWETFSLFTFGKDQCSLRSSLDNFVSVELENGNIMTSSRKTIGSWETFTINYLDPDTIALKGVNGKYLSYDDKTTLLYCSADSIGEKEKFGLIHIRKDK
jgi:hypothetical protein